MTNRIFLLLDIDGVLADFQSNFIKKATKKFPDRIFNLSDWKNYCPWGNNGFPIYSREEFDSVYLNLDWEDLDTIDTFEKFRDLSHEVEFVRIVTARPNGTLEATKKWLAKNKIHYDEIFIDRSENKWKYCSDLTHVADDNDLVIDEIRRNCRHMIIIPVPRIYNNQEEK